MADKMATTYISKKEAREKEKEREAEYKKLLYDINKKQSKKMKELEARERAKEKKERERLMKLVQPAYKRIKGKGAGASSLAHPLQKKLDDAVTMANEAYRIMERIEAGKATRGEYNYYVDKRDTLIKLIDDIATKKDKYEDDEEFDEMFRSVIRIYDELEDAEKRLKGEAEGQGLKKRRSRRI